MNYKIQSKLIWIRIEFFFFCSKVGWRGLIVTPVETQERNIEEEYKEILF